MRKLCISLVFILISTAPLIAAGQQGIRWARGDAPSPNTFAGGLGLKGVYCVGGQWEFWPVSGNLPLRCYPEFDTSISHINGIIDTFLSPDIASVCVAADNGNELIAACSDGNIISWLPLANRLALITKLYGVSELCSSANGTVLAFSTFDSTVRVFDRTANREIRYWKGREIESISLSPDGKLLLIGSPSEELSLFDVGTGRVLHKYPEVQSTDFISFNPMRPGIFLVNCTSSELGLTLMDTMGTILANWPDDYESRYSPSGSYIIASSRSAVRPNSVNDIINLDTKEVTPVTVLLLAFADEDDAAHFGEDAMSFYSVSRQRDLGVVTSIFSDRGVSYSSDGVSLVGGESVWSAEAGSVTAGPYIQGVIGTKAILDCFNGKATILEGQSATPSTLPLTGTDTVGSYSVAVSPTDSFGAVSFTLWRENGPLPSELQSIRLLDLKSASIVRTFSTGGWPARSLGFSHDGSMLAATLATGTTYVWNVHTGDKIVESLGSRANSNVFFLPGDSSLLLPASGMISYMSLQTGEVVDRANPEITSNTFAMSSDGRWSAGITNYRLGTTYLIPDKGIQIVDNGSGRVLQTIATPDSALNTCVAVNPHSGDIAIGGRDLVVFYAPSVANVRGSERLAASGSCMVKASNHRILIDPNAENLSVRVVDLLGRQVFAQEVNSTPCVTPPLGRGAYFVTIRTSNQGTRFEKIYLE